MMTKITISFFLFIAILSQFSDLINLDNAWLLYCAEQILAGKTLGEDIVETNPPLIIYLNLIPALIANLTDLSLNLVFNITIFSVCLYSIYRVTKIIEDSWVLIAFSAAILFFIGGYFGQREHLIIMFIMPFIMARIHDKANYSDSVIAAIGFAIKPYYIPLWLLTEIFYSRKNIFNKYNFVIGFLILAYVIYLFFFEKSYVKNTLPILLDYYKYYKANSKALIEITVVYLMLLLPFIFWFVSRKKHNKEIVFFSLAGLICFLAFYIQGKGWLGHFYPVIFFVVIANILIVKEVTNKQNIRANQITLVAVIIAVLIPSVFASFHHFSRIFMNNSKSKKEIIKILDQYAANEYFYPLTIELNRISPEIIYTKAKYGSRYGHLWMLPGIYKDAEKDENGEIIYNKPQNRNLDENIVIKNIIDDLNKNRPQLILAVQHKLYTDSLGNFKFNLIDYMLQNEEFKRVFIDYDFLTKIDDIEIYKYKDAHE